MPEATTVRRLPHVPALDGLRGLAVLAVVAFHAYGASSLHQANPAKGGWIGVDVFFVLSGFLITALLLAEHDERGSVDLKGFLARRGRRLLPALGLFLVVYLVVTWTLWAPSVRGLRASYGLSVYVNDVRAAGSRTTVSGISHTWSLAVEEQFYLVWPLLLVGALRLGVRPRTVLAGTAGAALASSLLAAALWERGAGWQRLYYAPDTHAAPILVGCAAGLAFTWGWAGRPGQWRASVPLAAAFLAVVALTQHNETGFPYLGGELAVAIAAAVLVLAAVDGHAGLTAVLDRRGLRATGRVSYGLYLWHPLLLAVAAGSGNASSGAATVALGLSGAAAAASYRWVEQPVRERKVGSPHPANIGARNCPV